MGHGHVGDDQIKGRRVVLKVLQGLDTARAGGDLIPQALQNLLAHVHQHGLVVHKKDTFGSRWQGHCVVLVIFGMLEDFGEIYAKRRSLAGLAFDVDGSAVALDDAMGDR